MPPGRKSAIERFLERVEITDSCWLWTGPPSSVGYGQFSIGNVTKTAHRWSYVLFVDDALDGLDIDHLCRVRLCVNPDHLEAVTHRENMRRGVWAAATKPECIRGHPLSGENLYTTPEGRRVCKTCRRVRGRVFDKSPARRQYKNARRRVP